MRPLLSKCALFILPGLILFVSAFAQNNSEKSFPPERNQAFVLFEKGDYVETINVLLRQTKLNPKDAEALNVLGMAYLVTDKIKDGRKACQKAVKLDPNNSSYRTNLARAFIAENKIDSALKESDRAIELDPKNRAAYYARGNAFLWQGRSQKAIENAESAITIDPGYSSAYILKADALLLLFSEKMSGDMASSEGLASLKQAVDVLGACDAKCDKNLNTKTLAERIDSLNVFYKYFDKKRSANPLEKPLPLPPNTTPIKILSKVAPGYTEAARKNQEEGVVRLAILFSADGKTKYVLPVKGLRYGLTERAVLAALQITFEPQTVDGKPISVVRVVEYHFDIY
jgi:TonB family protein